MVCREEAAELISHMEKGLHVKVVMLVPFGNSCSEGQEWIALIMNETKGIFLFLILQASIVFLISPTGERLHGLCSYFIGKTAFFLLHILRPF